MRLLDIRAQMGRGCNVNGYSIGEGLEPARDLTKITAPVTSPRTLRGLLHYHTIHNPADHLTVYPKASENDLLAPEIASYTDIPDYRLIQKIGEGAFSNVYKAVRKSDNVLVALKIISKENLDSKQHDNVCREGILARGINHPNIVRLIDFRETPYNYIIVLEFMSGGELYTTLFDQVCFPESVCRNVIYQIAKALEYLHEERGIVHRDIKLENILFNSVEIPKSSRLGSPIKEEQVTADPDAGKNIGVVKIADFGLSKVVFNTSTLTPCGTVGYTAPEILRDGKYSKGVDVWALGCVLYTMLCGFPPFFDDSPKGLADKVSGGDYAFPSPWWDPISIESKDLITHLLEIDPTKRYTIKEFLSHPWMKKEQFDASYIPLKKLPTARTGFLPDEPIFDAFSVGGVTSCSLMSDYSFIVENTSKSIAPELVTCPVATPARDTIETPEVQRVPSCPDYSSNNNIIADVAAQDVEFQCHITHQLDESLQNDSSSRRQNRVTRAKYPPPFELCSKDLVAAPLSIYQGMSDDMNPSVLQFVKVYNGNGVVPAANNARKLVQNLQNNSVSQSDSLSSSNTQIHSNTSHPPQPLPLPVVQMNSSMVIDMENDRVPATEVKIIHGLRRNVKSFKLDMELSPLYNRRRRVRMGVAN